MGDGHEWNGSLTAALLLTEDCSILRANKTAARWLKYEQSELEGLAFHFLLGGGGQFFLHSQILPMLKLKGSLEEVYLRMKDKDGAQTPVLANIGTVTTENGTRIEFSFVRIIQRGRLEDELLQAKKLADQASDAKTKFLGMMSHELRTPLQLMSLNTQLLLEEGLGPLNPDQKQALEASNEANHSVAVLIDDILNYARMEGGSVQVSPTVLEVDQILTRAGNSVRHRVDQAGLTLSTRKHEALQVRADPNRLQQILVNLLNNAIKFTPRGGRLVLHASRSDDMVAIAVSDTGRGIPRDQVHRVFEPFVQLGTTIESADKPGVGLGLAICRDLARAMGGRMSLESSEGVGSTFFVHLPPA